METTQGNEGTPGEAGSALPPGPPPVQTHQASRRPIWRSRTDRWIAGVAGGLAQYFGIDSLIVRVLFVGLAFVGGLGVILYLAAWFLVPEEGTDRAAGQDLVDRAKGAPTWLAILLIVLGAAIALPILGFWIHPRILWSAALIAAGIWLYRRPDTAPPPPPAQPPETQPGAGSRAASGTVPPSAYSSATAPTAPISSTATAPTAPPWTPPAPAARRRKRSALGRLTIAIGLVVIGLIAMLHNAGILTVSPRHFPAIALLVVGGGLLVGSLWGRARGLIFLGLLLVPFALTASAFNGSLRGGTGDRMFAPVSAAEAAPGYRLGAGGLRIDLTGMDWSQPVNVKATLGVGEIDVTVPPDVRVDVHSHVSAGSIVLFGVERNGTDVVFDTVDGSPTATKTLALDARVTFGQVKVIRSTALPAPAQPAQPGDFGPPGAPAAPAAPTAPAAPAGATQLDGGA